MANSELRAWQLNAAEQQNTFYRQFGDREWDSIQRTDTNALNTKISFTLHSKPYETCDFEEKDSINATKEKVLQLCGSGDVLLGCVFVNVLPGDTREPSIVSLIRTKQTYGDDIYFIERQPGRVYTGWTDFVENHKLPSGNMCYPADGFYRSRFNQRVNIEFREISGVSVVGAVLDVTSAVAKTASAGLIAASLFFPLATPFVIGAVAVLGTSTAYSVTRAVVELVDRGTHHEPIDLTDARARELWIGTGIDVIGSVLIGGAAVLPRLVASGRLASSMASSIMDVFNFVSIGVNSFGVLANVVVLIGKLRSGTLESADISYFISSCLFIGNIVVNAFVAERVIQSLSNRPSQVRNIFKMISNTSFSTIKQISIADTCEKVVEIICGDPVVSIMRFAGMDHSAQILTSIKGVLRQFYRGSVSILSLCMKLERLLRCHLMQVLDEVAEAWKKIRAFFISFNLPRNSFMGPSLEAAEIVNSAERVLDDIDIHNEEEREDSRNALVRAVFEMSGEMNARTEREFSNLCQMALNDISRRCERRMVLGASERYHLYPEDRSEILREAIREFREEFRVGSEIANMNGNTMQNSDLPLIPLITSDDIDKYVFQVPYRLPEFDQFIYDAACHLLDDDDFLNHCRIELGNGPIILIQSYGNTLIFYYEQLRDSDSAIGFVLRTY